jgi:hypothetical protein
VELNNNFNMKKIETFISVNKKIIYTISIIVFTLFLWTFFSIRWDDSYIAYRYALNFHESGYWNWNADNNYVEAYTNFSYALLTLIPVYLRVDPTIFFTAMNVFWIILIIYRLNKRLNSKILFFCSLLLTILNPFVAYHISTGMETIFFIFLLFESFRCLINSPTNNTKEVYFYFILLLLPLTRPEGAIYSVVCFCVNYFINKKKIEKKLEFIIIILIGLSYMTWRSVHFDSFLPNTFYLKSIKGVSLKNWLNFAENSRLYLILLIFLNIFIRKKVIISLSVLTILISFLLYAPSDLVTTINDRFQLQIFLPLFLVSFLFINNEKIIPIISISILWFYVGSYTSLENIKSVKPFSPSMYVYKKIGQSLNKFSTKKYSLLIGEAGIIPYYSKWKCFDFIGLADKELSRHNISFQYLEKRSPDLIFLYSSTKDETGVAMNSYQQNIVYDYIKNKRYYNKIGSLNNGGWYLLIFMKSSIPDYIEIQNEVSKISNFSESIMNKQYGKENIRNWYMLKYIK